MYDDATGWFAEWEDDDGSGWRPVLQCSGGFMVTCQGPWFYSEQECLDFIRHDILGAGMFDEGD